MNSKTRNILLIVAVIVIAGGLFFYKQASRGGNDVVTIRFWNGFTGPDGRTILKLVRRFNEENPDTKVLVQRVKWATYYNKLFVAGIGDRAPEVFIVHTSGLERFKRAGLLRCIDDMVTGTDGIDTDDFSREVLEAVRREGKTYGLPLDTHMMGMYYNNALLKRAGIVDGNGDPKPPADLEEFLYAIKTITTLSDESDNTKIWGFAFTWARTNVASVMWQFGGSFFSEDKTKCTLNSPENVEALQFCADIINKLKVSPPPGTESSESWIGFCQGNVGMLFEGIYMLPNLERLSGLDYAGAPIPLLGKKNAVWADSHVICLSNNLKEKKLEASWLFTKFLSDNSLDWARGGQIPVRKSILRTDGFKEMAMQNRFAEQLPYIRYMPQIPFIGEFCGEFDIAIEKALRGSATAQQALDVATVNVNKTILRYEKMYAVSEGKGQ